MSALNPVSSANTNYSPVSTNETERTSYKDDGVIRPLSLRCIRCLSGPGTECSMSVPAQAGRFGAGLVIAILGGVLGAFGHTVAAFAYKVAAIYSQDPKDSAVYSQKAFGHIKAAAFDAVVGFPIIGWFGFAVVYNEAPVALKDTDFFPNGGIPNGGIPNGGIPSGDK